MRNPKIISDLKDPTGWTLQNNPRPNKYVSDPLDEEDWRNWHEWDKNSTYPIKCHKCILRAKIGTGNCVDGGDYFICLPKDVREGRVGYVEPKRTVQTKLM